MPDPHIPSVNTTSTTASDPDPTGALAALITQKPSAPTGSGDSRVSKESAQNLFADEVAAPAPSASTTTVAATVDEALAPPPSPPPATTQATTVPSAQDTDLPEEAGPSLLARISDGAKDVIGTVKDEFTALANQFSEMQVFDTFYVPEASIVTFHCPNKKFSATDQVGLRVQGILAEAFGFHMESKWDTKGIGGLPDADKVLAPLDALTQSTFGTSINQPVLARRRWGGTSPLESTVKVQFVARNRLGTAGNTTEKEDVYDKVVSLLQLLLPREVSRVNEESSGILSLFAIPGPNPFGSGLGDALEHIVGKYKPDFEMDTGGDIVSIKIGKMVSINSAYITKVDGSFSKALGPTGYPLGAFVTVSFSAIDAPYLKKVKDGKHINLDGNNPFDVTAIDVSKAMESFMSATKELMSDIKDSMLSSVKKREDNGDDPASDLNLPGMSGR